MLQQQADNGQPVAHGSEHQRSGIEIVSCTQVYLLRYTTHYRLDSLVVTVERDVVDRSPTGVVVLEQIFYSAVA